MLDVDFYEMLSHPHSIWNQINQIYALRRSSERINLIEGRTFAHFVTVRVGKERLLSASCWQVAAVTLAILTCYVLLSVIELSCRDNSK
jgi:hypothetical protein